MTKIDIPIRADVFDQMFEYAHAAKKIYNSEISGWGHYSEKKGIYRLAPLQEQVCHGSESETASLEILNSDYDMSDMYVQWHSHVDMGVTPSGDYGDIGTIKKIVRLMPFVISIIVNCKGQYSARLDIGKVGGKEKIMLPDLMTMDVNLIPYYHNKDIEKEVKEKLKKPEPKVYASVSQYSGTGNTGFQRQQENKRTEIIPHTGQGAKGNSLATTGQNAGTGKVSYISKPTCPLCGSDCFYSQKNDMLYCKNNNCDNWKGIKISKIAEQAKRIQEETQKGKLSLNELNSMLEKMEALANDFPFQFEIILMGSTSSAIHHLPTGTIAMVDEDGLVVNNIEGFSWLDFLDKVGCKDMDGGKYRLQNS